MESVFIAGSRAVLVPAEMWRAVYIVTEPETAVVYRPIVAWVFAEHKPPYGLVASEDRPDLVDANRLPGLYRYAHITTWENSRTVEEWWELARFRASPHVERVGGAPGQVPHGR